MSRTLKNEYLYIQEDHNMFANCSEPFLLVLLSNFWGALLNPTPLIPLPSVSIQCKTFHPMLVRGKMLASGGGRPPPPAKEPPSPSRLMPKQAWGGNSLLDTGLPYFELQWT